MKSQRISMAQDRANSAMIAYQRVAAENPAGRPLFRASEIAADVTRVLPPLLTGIVALIALLMTLTS